MLLQEIDIVKTLQQSNVNTVLHFSGNDNPLKPMEGYHEYPINNVSYAIYLIGIRRFMLELYLNTHPQSHQLEDILNTYDEYIKVRDKCIVDIFQYHTFIFANEIRAQEFINNVRLLIIDTLKGSEGANIITYF